MLTYQSIICPRCGKKHFKEKQQATDSLFAGLFASCDLVYRKPAERIYKDGVLQNPKDFVPVPTKQYFECLECGCNFSAKTIYEYVGGDINYAESYEFIDEDKAKEEREAAWKKQREEQEAKRKAEAEKKKSEEAVQDLTGCLVVKGDDNTSLTIGGTTGTINCSVMYKDQDLLKKLEELEARIKELEEKHVVKTGHWKLGNPLEGDFICSECGAHSDTCAEICSSCKSKMEVLANK